MINILCPFCEKEYLVKVEHPDIWYWACPLCDSTYYSEYFEQEEVDD